MSGKYALVIANTDYTDPGLAQLKAPGQDAKEFWRILSSPDICAFDDVNMLLNDDSYRVAEQIEIFFEKKKPDDLLLLFFSGHGVKDENGALYLAVRNTNRRRLRSTAVQAHFIRSVMDECRSRRQVLILDCCNSGAFAHGTKAETGGSVGTATAFKGTGYGRVVLTASDSTQFAWEGDRVIGETENSLFTHFLIKGLEGEADRNGEGRITLDDLYDYAYEQIVTITPNQTPGKWSFKQQGEIILRERIPVEDVTPLPLPADLLDEIEDKRPYVREAALQQLVRLMNGKNRRLALSARAALEHMAEHDDSRTIANMAIQALEGSGQATAETGVKEAAVRLSRQEAGQPRWPAQTAPASEHREPAIAAPALARLARSGIDSLRTAFTGGKLSSRQIVIGAGAVVLLAVAGLTARSLFNPRNTSATEPPSTQSTDPSVSIPETELTTNVPNTPTSDGPISLPGPALEVGSTYPYVDGTVLVPVPAGEFAMGGGGADNPEHTVSLSDYWIYSTEVTNQQYKVCVDLGRCSAPNADSNPGYANSQRGNDPVTGVTYAQAAGYCEFVNGRLPTEAEWEKAAQDSRGGTYPWGDAAPTCDLLNFDNCIEGMTNVVTHWNGVSYYGALGMAGNAFEWVADWYDRDYYNDSPAEDPQGPEGGTQRSVRSSSYASQAGDVAVATRNAESPQNQRADLGFRCVVEDPAKFAPFCEVPLVYAGSAGDALESCPALEIKPVPFCNGSIPLANITFVGPDGSTIDAQNCLPSGNPNLFTCQSRGTVVSISAACELSDPGDAACPSGYTAQGDICVADGETAGIVESCLAGSYSASQGCCRLPTGQAQTCPVGTFYAANANACLPQPVQEIITVTHEVALATSCTASGGGGGGGGGGGSGGCTATQAQIDNCNAGAPFYSWNSATCSCDEN